MPYSPSGKGTRPERLDALAAALERIYKPRPNAIPPELARAIARLAETHSRAGAGQADAKNLKKN